MPKLNFNKERALTLISITIIAMFLAISMISSVSAVDITINPSTSGGIAKAIDSAGSNDVTVYLENGVYKGTGNFNIIISGEEDSKGNKFNKNNSDRKVNIIGKGSKVVIDGGGKGIFYIVRPSDSLSLTNVEVMNGNKIAIRGQGLITVKDCIFTSNYAAISGAYITANNCKFNNNSIAIAARGVMNISNCKFNNNDRSIYYQEEDDENAFTGILIGKIINCTFNNNKGSTITFNALISDLTISNCVFTKNKGYSVHARAGGNLTIKECNFTNNEKSCVYISKESNSVSINDSVFTNNKEKLRGAAIYIDGGLASNITKCTFTKNHAGIKGGAVFVDITKSGSVKISDSKFVKNSAGKIYNAISYIGTKPTRSNITITPKDGTKYTPTKTLKVLSSKATVSGKTVAISIALDKSKVKTGKTIVKLKTPVNMAYKNYKVSLGSATYNAKTKVLTWSIANSALVKKQTKIKWNLKANKKGSYKVTPTISSSGNKVINKKTISFKIK